LKKKAIPMERPRVKTKCNVSLAPEILQQQTHPSVLFPKMLMTHFSFSNTLITQFSDLEELWKNT
jgi:hypothetical protein